MQQEFWDRGYVVIEDLLDPSKLAFLTAAMDVPVPHERERNEDFVFEALDVYSPYAGEVMLRYCRPKIEEAIGRELLETLAYWRTYRTGAKLLKHIDRASYEVSASITVATDSEDGPWPIMVQDLQGNERAIELPPGAGVLYQGHKVVHWRDEFKGASQKQLFLAYVLKDGEFADHIYDSRGADPLTRDTV
ncbi:MAG: hypothetical protein AAF687_12910 [Pseudomonadota bacterium]